MLEQGISNGARAGLGILGVAIVVAYAAFSFGLPERYNSPDEAANAFFATAVANNQGLTVASPLNILTGAAVVHPRSTQVINSSLAPVSFPGLPLIFGYTAKLVGTSALPYFTPLAALVGLVSFYLLLRVLSGRRVATIATLLLSVTPAFWYYHARGFFHNAVFFDLLLLSAYVADRAMITGRKKLYFVTGIVVGLALSFRTSEAIIIAVSGVAWFMLYGNSAWKKLWLTALGSVVGLVPLFVGNYMVYGSIVSFGYQSGIDQVTLVSNQLSQMISLVLPFGFHPRVISTVIRDYLLSLSWWWAVLAGVGAFNYWNIRKLLTKSEQAFAGAGLLCSVWLVVMYGSWKFNDNPDPTAVTIGTSYVRYFLPIYAFMLLFAAQALARWWSDGWRRVAVATAIAVYVLLSLNLVVFESREGLLAIRQNIKKFATWNAEVQNITDSKSVIVSGFTDKIFWPEREVIYALANEADYSAVTNLLQKDTPVYYFHPSWTAKDFSVVSERDFTSRGLTLSLVRSGFEDFSLYQIQLVKE